MIFYVGNTDYQWYQFLRKLTPEDINFWQPGGKLHFRAINQGAPFLLRLKSPINKIAGIGFFSSHSLLPIDFAWDVFKERNGADSFDNFKKKINSYRESNNQLDKNPVIGCIILTNPIFFNEGIGLIPR
jgi:putative restriction endonuclease